MGGMKRTVFGGLLITGLLWAGWRYAPPRTREALLGFVGLASRRIQGQDVPAAEVRRAVEDAVLPDSPAERREALIRELRQNISDLRRREMIEAEGADAAIAAGFSSDDTQASTTAADVLADTERIVKELEGANQDGSAGARVMERIIERILPPAQCRNE